MKTKKRKAIDLDEQEPQEPKDSFTARFGFPRDDLSEENLKSSRKQTTVILPKLNLVSVSLFSNSRPLRRTADDSVRLKKLLKENLAFTNETRAIECENGAKNLSAIQEDVFDLVSDYRDFYLPRQRLDDADELRIAVCLHVLNHVLKSRSLVLKNNAALKKMKEQPRCEQDEIAIPAKRRTLAECDDEKSEEKCKDQGFTRPRVLYLTPFRSGALKIVNVISDLMFGSSAKGFVANRKRFESEYGYDADVDEDKDKPRFKRSADFDQTFAGNTDDCFRLNISVAKKSVKLHVSNEHCDIIVASPLGIRSATGVEDQKDFDADFLSSIEIVVCELTDIFLMQNWSHVLHVFRHLNQRPAKVTSLHTNLSRIRNYMLNDQSRFYRQTIVLSRLDAPEIRALFSKFCLNFDGLAMALSFSVPPPSISQIMAVIPQAFYRFDSNSVQDDADCRFDFFCRRLLPDIKSSPLSNRLLVFVSSYFDFVRLRNLFKSAEHATDISFVQACEYSSVDKISRARDLFFHGKKHVMLLTERFHFFKRYAIRGVRHVIFYQLPLYNSFYADVCDWTKWSDADARRLTSDGDAATLAIDGVNRRRRRYDKNERDESSAKENRENAVVEPDRNLPPPTCTVLFSKYDALRLAAVLGDEKAAILLRSDQDVHVLESKD